MPIGQITDQARTTKRSTTWTRTADNKWIRRCTRRLSNGCRELSHKRQTWHRARAIRSLKDARDANSTLGRPETCHNTGMSMTASSECTSTSSRLEVLKNCKRMYFCTNYKRRISLAGSTNEKPSCIEQRLLRTPSCRILSDWQVTSASVHKIASYTVEAKLKNFGWTVEITCKAHYTTYISGLNVSIFLARKQSSETCFAVST